MSQANRSNRRIHRFILCNSFSNRFWNLRSISNQHIQSGHCKSDNQANIGQIARVKEYILCFCKSKINLNLNKIPLTEKAIKEYSYSDTGGKFRRGILLDKTRGRHFYDVKTKTDKQQEKLCQK